MGDVIETDYTTDPPTVTERDFTADELAQIEADRMAVQAAQHEAAERETVRAAAIAHAKSLGFTDAMIAVMYPNLTMGA